MAAYKLLVLIGSKALPTGIPVSGPGFPWH